MAHRWHGRLLLGRVGRRTDVRVCGCAGGGWKADRWKADTVDGQTLCRIVHSSAHHRGLIIMVELSGNSTQSWCWCVVMLCSCQSCTPARRACPCRLPDWLDRWPPFPGRGGRRSMPGRPFARAGVHASGSAFWGRRGWLGVITRHQTVWYVDPFSVLFPDDSVILDAVLMCPESWLVGLVAGCHRGGCHSRMSPGVWGLA